MVVARDPQALVTAVAGHDDDLMDEVACNPAASPARIDEQVVQFGARPG